MGPVCDLGFGLGLGLEVWGRGFMNLGRSLVFKGFRVPGLESGAWT